MADIFVTNEEYLERIGKVQAKLRELDLDAAIVYANSCTYENLRYLTGMWPLFERGGLCIPREGKAVQLIGAEAPGLARETCLGDSYMILSEFGHTFPMKWKGAEYKDFNALFDQVSNGKGVRRVGLTDLSITPYETYVNIQKALLPGGEIVDIAQTLLDIRRIKSEKEIDLMRRANLINEKVFEEFLGKVKPEMTEYQAQGLIVGGMYEHGGEGESFPTLLYAGKRSLNQIGRGTHTPLGTNRIIGCDFGTILGTYASAYSRPFMFGKMPQKMKDEINFVIDLHLKVVNEWVRPGVHMKDIQAKYIEAFEKAGYGYPPAGASHCIGIFECEPPLMSQGGGILEENMTLAADHFFKSAEWGFRFEDCYRVTATGAEMFTGKFLKPIEL